MSAIPVGSQVAVLGAGTMGRGIARVAAGCGHLVALFDSNADALHSAEVDIHRYLQRDVEKGRLEDSAAGAIADRITFTSDVAAVAGSALVIEAIVEDLAAKVGLLQMVEAQLEPDAIIATNTSSLSITAIASGLELPKRVAGMHFFNPAPVMPLVEVVAGLTRRPRCSTALAQPRRPGGRRRCGRAPRRAS